MGRGAEVELSLLSTGIGLLPTLMFEVSSGEQEPSLPSCQGRQHNSLDRTNHVLVCR